MKLASLIEFIIRDTPSIDLIFRYMNVDLNRNLREISQAFQSLDFLDNFESFEFTGTVLSNSELAIRNLFRGGITPTKRLLLRGDTYAPYVVDGDTPWNPNFVYLKNTHATNDAVITMIFFR